MEINTEKMSPNSSKDGAPQLPTDEVDDTYFVSTAEKKKKRRKLPPWLDHFNAKDLKVLLKCSVAVWIMTILIFINPTLRLLGQAAFFGCVVLFIVPPSGVVFIHVMAGITIILGLSLGWAWGVITMKAALATRPTADLNRRYQQLQQSMPKNTTNAGQASGQTTYLQIAIYEGFMLDTRVSVTYFCMMGLFVYLMARLRVAAPKLTLVAIFAMVVSDIYLTTAPLIPTFQGTIPKVMILPVAVAVGIGLVCNTLIFPQSTSSIIRDQMKDVLTPMKNVLGALDWHLKNPRSRFDLNRLYQTKGEVTAAYASIEGSMKFLSMDFSYGKWGSEDITSLSEPLRQILVTFGELLHLQIAREENKVKESGLLETAKALYGEKDGATKPQVGYHQISKALDLRTRIRHPDTDPLLERSLQLLSVLSAPLMVAWREAFGCILVALDGRAMSQALENGTGTSQRGGLDNLKRAESDFIASYGPQLLESHSHLFDNNGQVIIPKDSEHPPPLFGMMLGLLFEERMLDLSKAIRTLLERIIEIESQRHNYRLWLPKGLQKLLGWALSKEPVSTTAGEPLGLTRTITTASHQAPRKRKFHKKAKRSEEKQKSEPINSAEARLSEMRNPTGRQRHKASTALLSSIRWISNTEGIFALRVLIVTIALAIPAVVPSSAGFFYREKGMWALIMAQFGLVPYAADFVSGLIIRTIGTIAGGIIGLVGWYIGAGSGPGNPYGLSAVMAVVIIILMWWRLFAPPEHMVAGIMVTSTSYMVVAYSWVDTHIPSYGNPGIGYNIFWRRILLVLIGFAAATLIAFFPRPTSAGKHYRRLLSESIESVKERYALFASTWREAPSDLVATIEKEAIATEEILTSIEKPIALTRYEFSTSNIDTKTLSQACRLCIKLNRSITQLLLYTAMLPSDLRARFIRNSNAGDENLIAELMAVLTLLQQSLRTGIPLPALIPTPLLSRSFTLQRENGAVDDVRPGMHLADEDGRKYLCAVSAFVQLLSSTDELVMVMKKAVGETGNVDLDTV